MKVITRLFLLFFTLLFVCCGTIRSNQDYTALTQAGIRLSIPIDEKDNHKLYITASQWIGVPYRSGGNSKKGIDCSSLTSQLYRAVYGKNISRGAERQRREHCKEIEKSHLKEGDLVFFHNSRHKETASHVGIYLKNRKFIHASSTYGVIVSSLDEEYWRSHWLSGGRINKH